jgi:hypothetical protein
MGVADFVDGAVVQPLFVIASPRPSLLFSDGGFVVVGIGMGGDLCHLSVVQLLLVLVPLGPREHIGICCWWGLLAWRFVHGLDARKAAHPQH